MRGSWWIFVEVTTTVTSMASLTRKPRSKYWFACFRDVNGKQRRRSTGQTDRKKALKVAEQFEQIGRRKLAPRTVRESLAELYREIYGETLPVATVRKFVADWLQTKEPEVCRYSACAETISVDFGERPRSPAIMVLKEQDTR